MMRMLDHMGRGVLSWLDVRGRGLGMVAFVLNRITGLALVVYLFLHFGLLSLLAAGPGAWNLFVAVAKSPLFLGFDILLFAGLLMHGLNGIRLAMLGFGIGLNRQRRMFLLAMLVGAGILFAAIVRLFTGS
jgi:succinate dehydrogenase / fumarate reductase, cytochrome b subunit